MVNGQNFHNIIFYAVYNAVIFDSKSSAALKRFAKWLAKDIRIVFKLLADCFFDSIKPAFWNMRNTLQINVFAVSNLVACVLHPRIFHEK